ncbi:hypothetical protein IV203_037468 [Nitzschia inconspicua]|uniref:Uncharacterized protein n=1 Tax=Nitzschia inconspicua TaxID=303405 RepID=A0A9K3LNZ1_9STRA|nr:hypothetical protein IV203_037468 [Nitzschia inconspicua]
MAPSSKRSCKQDDDDSDDDFLSEMKPTFARSSRSSADAKKARKDAEHKRFMNGVLKSGEQRLEQQSRIDEVHQRSSVIKSPALMDNGHSTMEVNGKENLGQGIAKTLFRQESPSKRDSGMDIKATMCLGSRNTLQLERIVKDTKMVAHNPSMACAWSSVDVARMELHGVLQWEKDKMNRQKEDNSSFVSHMVPLYNHILERIRSNGDFATFLWQSWLCEQQQDHIQQLPVTLLHWLFSMACAPIATLVPTTESMDVAKIGLDPVLISAKVGAYNTLARLWKSQMGNPCERTPVLTLKALSDQLRDWFGSSFAVENDDDKKVNSDENIEPRTILVTSTSPSTMVRFLHLWELALHNGLVQVFTESSRKEDKKNKFQEVTHAVVALLWASLDPIFGSSKCALNDGTTSMQRIVSSLIEAVRQEIGDDDIYQTWIQELAIKIYEMWSTQLGGGHKDTDAKEDERAWLAIVRTVQCLGSNSSDGPLNHLQFELLNCVIFQAFDESQGQDTDCIKRNREDGWLFEAVADCLENWNVPSNLRNEQCWITIATASAAIGKLASNFPDEDPTKCLALIQSSVVCFSMGIFYLCHQKDMVRQLLETGVVSPGIDDDRILPDDVKLAFCCAMGQLEENCDRISSMSRSRSMQNQCFPRSSYVVECLKSYTRLLKGRFAPPAKSSEGQQTTIDSFFSGK